MDVSVYNALYAHVYGGAMPRDVAVGTVPRDLRPEQTQRRVGASEAEVAATLQAMNTVSRDRHPPQQTHGTHVSRSDYRDYTQDRMNRRSLSSVYREAEKNPDADDMSLDPS